MTKKIYPDNCGARVHVLELAFQGRKFLNLKCDKLFAESTVFICYRVPLSRGLLSVMLFRFISLYTCFPPRLITKRNFAVPHLKN